MGCSAAWALRSAQTNINRTQLITRCTKAVNTHRFRSSKRGILLTSLHGCSHNVSALTSSYFCRCSIAREPLKNYLTHPGGVEFGKKCSFTACKLGNCSCIALPPASMQSSAIAPALLYLDFIPDEILPPPSMGSSCLPAVVRFFCQIRLASASPPTFFRGSLIQLL